LLLKNDFVRCKYMSLPTPLLKAIEAELAQIPTKRLAEAVTALSQYYHEGPETIASLRRATAAAPTADYLLAYLTARLPATYAAISKVLTQLPLASESPLVSANLGSDTLPASGSPTASIAADLPTASTPINPSNPINSLNSINSLDLAIESLLDLASGPATVYWAVKNAFPQLSRATLVERDGQFLALARRIAAKLTDTPDTLLDWQQQDLIRYLPIASYDLVVLSYALGELPVTAQSTVLQKAWQATKKWLIIIEPGTKQGFARILAARTALLSSGAHLVAPCATAAQCPLANGSDWCHFAARLPRTVRHRQAKAGKLAYEDEKFAYLIASPIASPNATFTLTPPARILRHPLYRIGHVKLSLCTTTGWQQETITARDKERYRRARKAAWGDSWCIPTALLPNA
jgi:ribosomal protein RSM22 (predicted rRNA methylase)